MKDLKSYAPKPSSVATAQLSAAATVVDALAARYEARVPDTSQRQDQPNPSLREVALEFRKCLLHNNLWRIT